MDSYTNRSTKFADRIAHMEFKIFIERQKSPDERIGLIPQFGKIENLI